MKKTDFNGLLKRLNSLAVLRCLLEDGVIKALMSYLESLKMNAVNKSVSLYAEFVSKLYESGSGSLSSYIASAIDNSENVYVKKAATGAEVENCILNAVKEELKTLQEVCNITKEELTSTLDADGFLPDFETEAMNLEKRFFERADNIGKYGYGIYASNRMFYIDSKAEILPVRNPDRTRLSDLVSYENERKIIADNTRALLLGKPAANVLLTGDAGTGKSSTVKALVNELASDGLRIIEVRREQLALIPRVLDELSENPLKFILFIDDLSFTKDDENFSSLKAVLEGSVSAKSKNVVIYATSNRRHIIKEKFSDREGDDIHRNDTMQELISLSERFGLHVTFSKPDKKTYLHIVSRLAEENGIPLDDNLELLAERFALSRGARSARVAKQFVENMVAGNIK